MKKLTDSICAKSAVTIGMGKQMFYRQLEMGLDGAYQLDKQLEKLIAVIEGKLNQTTTLLPLFVIRWVLA